MMTTVLDGNTLLKQVDGKFGAPMGRRNITDNPTATVTLFRLRVVDECYDVGGAYWGMSEDNPVYGAIGEGFEHFQWAKTLADAKVALLKEFPELTVNTSEVNDDFVAAYIRCAMWSSNDESTESGGVPIDQNYGPDDLDEDSRAKMVEDCRQFLEKCGHLITQENLLKSGNPFEHAGNDFWLTRNGHGSGFLDGDWVDEVDQQLYDLSHEFGESYLSVEEDGKVYCD